jgi:ketosteroid isomerase-like protein
MDRINDPRVVAELTALAWRYERALVSNDIPTLDALFWHAPEVVRLGATENLYGEAQIRAFRKARPTANLAREVRDLRVVTFGDDTGCVTLEFVRVIDGVERHGRQSQTWRRFADGGWKVVSAHISVLAAPPLRITISDETAAAG